MAPDVSEKVDVSRILIQRVEGMATNARVSSMEAANAVLERWADGAAASGQEKCDVQIVFEDGFRIRGHYNLAKSRKRVSLSRYVRKQLTALAGTDKVKKTAKQEDDPELSLSGEDPAISAKLALDHYNI